MHICLPDTREVKPQHGSAYLLYNVHIDGLYHCSLRYKQLLHLHQALAKRFNSTTTTSQLPTFPPKKLLPMSVNQVEERRQQLEKYLQNISQDKAISNSSIFNLFLLEAQRESTRIRQDQAHLDIELVNGQKIRLQVFTHDSADAVLTSVCRALGLSDRYHAYFCLCLCGYDVIRDKLIIKRRLSFFESPYVTLQMAIQQQEQLQNVLLAANGRAGANQQCNCCLTTNSNNRALTSNTCQCLSCLSDRNLSLTASTTNDVPQVGSSNGSSLATNNSNNNNTYFNTSSNRTIYTYPTHQNQNHTSATTSSSSFVTHRILLRKSYWDPIYDTYILSDRQALNLLFIQTVYDIKHSLMFVDRETYHKLESLLATDSKLEYILLARTLKYYNYVHFEPCLSDYPRPRTKVMISIGSKELNMRVLKSPRPIAKSPAATVAAAAAGASSTQPRLATNNGNSNNGTSTANQLLSPDSLSSASTSASSSPSSISDVLSSSAASSNTSTNISASQAVNSNNNNKSTSTTTTTNQQVKKETSDQILYCTSSMVPNGYRHLITKDDLVEEEYNFKVPLIRCWRLTSLETLNSNNHQPAAAAAAPSTDYPSSNSARRKLSLFNSLSINSSSSNNSTQQPSNGQQQHQQRNQNLQGRRNSLMGSGTGGSSLLAALVGSANGFHRLSLPQHHQQPAADCCNQHHQHPYVDGTQSHNRCPSNTAQATTATTTLQPFSQYELSFEYLVSKDTLRWITISSDQAIFISISLQGVVDELVSKRDGSSSLYQTPSPTSSLLVDSVAPGANLSSQSIITHSNNNQQQQSFTYLYRDGRQKTLNTNNQQLIDKFGTTLGYSPTNPNVLALARQRQQILRANSSSSFLSTSSGSRFAFLGGAGGGSTSAADANLHSSLEISHLKKAPSPIINDAFEGVTNDDDL